MENLKTMHVWLPHGRSLCDRRFRSAAASATDDDAQDAELAPACGSCLVLANRLRRQAAVLLKTQPSVSPAAPWEAWAALRGTRWEQIIGLGNGDEEPETASCSRFEAVACALEQSVIQALDCPDARRRYRRCISGAPG